MSVISYSVFRCGSVYLHCVPFPRACFRVHPENKVFTLRDDIEQQLGLDLTPKDYVFMKCVGRSLTRVSHVTNGLWDAPRVYQEYYQIFWIPVYRQF